MLATKCHTQIDSPVGVVVLERDGDFLTGVYLPNHKGWSGPAGECRREDALLTAASRQVEEYFAGERTAFDVPVRLTGTPFQERVWQELTRIPYGVTISYGELARRVGQPTASRAVGAANGRNPISILVPCHRVVGSKGELTGYGGGMEAKRWLLEWEAMRRRETAGESLLVGLPG
ncbi:Methylated-DNA--protein-cysteine methyltransferase [Caulifigura coniformis]|uniref:Methylated-DNA--protein-cysteine methyltransferase n=1 Tax=Caulifigura coniformis TaxID=2527983 RepID=A0A517S7B1_9PLAN|nr:methylated-DNA--[protein]-cysteine S-methyltransferase [Caulifigura coniformis]QDT52003.1 Methylated-DNA--protein-cysteine methyltransferase [Caulifigura coniformis]